MSLQLENAPMRRFSSVSTSGLFASERPASHLSTNESGRRSKARAT